MWAKIKTWLKSVRFWLYSVGSTVAAYSWVDPFTALTIYNMLPPVLHTVLPHNVLLLAGGILFAGAVLVSFAKKKPDDATE